MTSKFKVGDIVCISTYPGRDHWMQVAEITEVHDNHYAYRPIQFKRSGVEWSTKSRLGGCDLLSRGGWQEEQTSLFHGKTLEQEEKEKDDRLRQIVREIVREEIERASVKRASAASTTTNADPAEYLRERFG